MSDQRTEKPTPRRLQKAREDGQFPSAKDFVGAMQYLGILLILSAWGASWFRQAQHDFRWLLQRAFSVQIDAASGIALAKDALWRILSAARYGSSRAAWESRWPPNSRPPISASASSDLAPSGARFNPLNKLKELPKQNVPAAIQAFASDGRDGLCALPADTRQSAAPNASALVHGAGRCSSDQRFHHQLLWRAAAVLMVFGFVELIRNRASYNKQLRMSKQEIRDEMKESEGNPQIKGQIRRLRRELLRRRMMQDVPTATAVIVNPTHYAVAIRYEMDRMASPLVVAKGKNYLALRIRQKAIDSGVPIIENPPLARGLYTAAEVGQEIPAEFYRAVAEVLAYIYRLMGRRRPN